MPPTDTSIASRLATLNRPVLLDWLRDTQVNLNRRSSDIDQRAISLMSLINSQRNDGSPESRAFLFNTIRTTLQLVANNIRSETLDSAALAAALSEAFNNNPLVLPDHLRNSVSFSDWLNGSPHVMPAAVLSYPPTTGCIDLTQPPAAPARNSDDDDESDDAFSIDESDDDTDDDDAPTFRVIEPVVLTRR